MSQELMEEGGFTEERVREIIISVLGNCTLPPPCRAGVDSQMEAVKEVWRELARE